SVDLVEAFRSKCGTCRPDHQQAFSILLRFGQLLQRRAPLVQGIVVPHGASAPNPSGRSMGSEVHVTLAQRIRPLSDSRRPLLLAPAVPGVENVPRAAVPLVRP